MEFDFLERQIKLVKEGRITDGTPDYVGTWDMDPFEGYFEVYVQDTDGENISGVIEDVNGSASFEGKVDESEVGKIKEGLPLEITVGAIKNDKFDAILDYIAPKGIEENGAIQFEIKGSLKIRGLFFIFLKYFLMFQELL